MKKKSNASQFLNLFLCICMVLCLTHPVPLSVSATEANTVTLYFLNSDSWANVYSYVWNGNGEAVAWPGVTMTKTGETIDNYDLYSITFDAADGNIVFNNGSGTQTVDLVVPTDGNNLYTYSTGQWSKYDACTHTWDAGTVITAATCTADGQIRYTCSLCGETYVTTIPSLAHQYENGICTACGVKEWDTDGDGALEILAIGNSFSIDALEYAYQIAQDLGIEEIVIGNLYISGCTLKTHAANAAGDIGNYKYYYNDNGTWTSTDSYKISTALESRNWDYVSVQQSSKYSGVESTYNEDLINLIAYVQDRSDAKLVWHMTWAYQQDSTNTAFPIYNSDQMTMYNAIVSAVQNKIVTNNAFDLIVPNGTAVQNSRTSLLGDTTTRDGYHMSRDYGQYLTGLMFAKTLTGLSVDEITYAPSGVDAQEMAIAIESVNNAYTNPFEVTDSAYTGEAPEEGYILLRSELYKGAFWSSTSERYNELFYDRSMSHKYFATIRFTKETLPVGSIIMLADGWRYRPDGWITDTVQAGPRDPLTTEPYVIVTEQWWGDYTIRGFNVCRVDGGTVMDLTEDEMRAIFQIYVPEESHIHANTSVVTEPSCTEKGYTTYTCTLCGGTYEEEPVDALGHDYLNGICSVCGEADPDYVEPVTITGKGFSLSFEDEILVNFYYTVSDLTDVVEQGMLVFYADPGAADIAMADDIYTGSATDGTMFMNTTDGIAAKYMGDNRYYCGYAKLTDGSYAYSPLYQYSPKKYAMNMLGKDSTSDKQKVLCVAMLNYGAAAQNFFDYNTDDLMNSALTDEQKALAVAYDETLFTGAVPVDSGKTENFAKTATGFSSRSATVSFEGAFAINYYFKPSVAVAGELTMYYWTPEAYVAASELTVDNTSGSLAMVESADGSYWGQVSGIAAKKLDDTYYVVGVYNDADGNTYCTGVIAYSLSKYCMNNAKDGNAMQELASQTAMYGYYAKIYFQV